MKRHFPFWILTILMASVMVFLDWRLYTSNLLPIKLVLLIAALLFVLFLIAALLLWDVKRYGRFIAGSILCVCLTAVMGLGGYVLHTAIETLDRLAGEQVTVSHVVVYTLRESSIVSLADLKEASIGIQGSRDRENTDKTVLDIEKEIGSELKLYQYETLTGMADELLGGQLDAIILNEAFLPMLTDMEEYADLTDRIREVTVIKVERPVETRPNQDSGDKNPESSGNEPFIVYLSGSDTRGTLSDQGRSDTNILAVVNPQTRQLLLLSTPRDYYVPLSISNGIKDKLTHAGYYGVQVSMDTLSMLYDVDVDYYFRVDFSGFKNIVDAIGGISVYSPCEFWSIDGFFFSEGYNDVDGEKALSFVRERYAFASGDIQRGKNQVETIKAIIRKCMSPSILTRFSDLMESLDDCFRMSVPYEVVADIVRNQLEDGGNWNVVGYNVSGTGNTDIPYSLTIPVYVMDPDWDTVDHAKELIRQVMDGEILDQES